MVNKARVWETATGRQVAAFDAFVAHFTPDGKQAISVIDWAASFRVHELPSGKIVRRFGPGTRLDFFSWVEGTRLATGSCGHYWETYDWATGERLCRVSWASWRDPFFLTPAGRHVLIQEDGRLLRSYDAGTGAEVEAYRALRRLPRLLRLSANGERVVCRDGRLLRTYEVATGRPLAAVEGGLEPWGCSAATAACWSAPPTRGTPTACGTPPAAGCSPASVYPRPWTASLRLPSTTTDATPSLRGRRPPSTSFGCPLLRTYGPERRAP
jgi:hypothetical protein